MFDLPKVMRDAAVRAADSDLRKKHATGIFEDGDPNHPKYNGGVNYAKPLLFGYDQQGFLDRQYHRSGERK